MQKPVVEMSEEEAVQDIKNGIDYLDGLYKKYGIEINMHINPTYVAKGTKLEKAFLEGKYTPPLLKSVCEAVLHAEGKNVSVFIGLNDEGLSVEGGSCIRDTPEDKVMVIKMKKFNGNQDFKFLRKDYIIIDENYKPIN